MAQYFSINRGSELPRLRLELIQDGKTDFRKFYLAIQAAAKVAAGEELEETDVDSGSNIVTKENSCERED